MKKSAVSLKNTVSKTEKGLKHLRLVGVGREYIEGRFAEMEADGGRKALAPADSAAKANGSKKK